MPLTDQQESSTQRKPLSSGGHSSIPLSCQLPPKPAFQVSRLFSFLLHWLKFFSPSGDKEIKSKIDSEMLSYSPCMSSQLSCPSHETQPLTLQQLLIQILMLTQAGRQMGLKERLLGQMGTIRMVLTSVWIMGPPADKAQAVEPVGVEIRIPSPAVVVNSWSAMQMSSLSCDWRSALLMTISFKHSYLSSIFPYYDNLVHVSLILASVLHSIFLPNSVASINYSHTFCTSLSQNLHRNPSVPFSKEIKSGVIFFWKSLFPYKMVPSPPTVITQSILSS